MDGARVRGQLPPLLHARRIRDLGAPEGGPEVATDPKEDQYHPVIQAETMVSFIAMFQNILPLGRIFCTHYIGRSFSKDPDPVNNIHKE